jgi:oligogalacturonide transport system substrate-binding protein
MKKHTLNQYNWKSTKSRIIALLLILIINVLFFYSCSKSGTSSGPVTLRMSWWGGDSRHEATLKAIERFEEKYPHITIKAEYAGWDGHLQKVATQIGGGDSPGCYANQLELVDSFFEKGRRIL